MGSGRDARSDSLSASRDTAPVERGSRDAAADVDIPAIGVVLVQKYRVESVLGRGGMGVVLEATHLSLKERVAIKLLLPHAASSAEAVSRFLREARSLARIRSEHVARVMDVGTLESGAPYLVMEHLTGSDLAAVLRARGRLPVGEAATYVLHACRAMSEAHALGIVHRDLKPANLFLTRASNGAPIVKVLDFGIAKAQRDDVVSGDAALTASTVLLGSPTYMSPEQVRAAHDVDARSDVWSLGVILYELCAGRPPFSAETASGLLAAIAADEPRELTKDAPGVPPALAAVVARCLDKRPERRPESAVALATELAQFATLAEGNASDTVGVVVSRSVHPTPRGGRILFAATVTAIGLAGAATLLGRRSADAVHQEHAAAGSTTVQAGHADEASATAPSVQSTAVAATEPAAAAEPPRTVRRTVAAARPTATSVAGAPPAASSDVPSAPAPPPSVDVEAATARRK